MRDALTLIPALLAGALLGGIFFGGLWWTIRRGLSSRRPALLFLGSLLLRTAAAVAGFYLVSGGHLPRMLACLLGFLLARFAVTRLASLPQPDAGRSAEGGVP